MAWGRGACACNIESISRSEDTLLASVLSTHHAGPKDHQSQFVRLSRLNHPAGPVCGRGNYTCVLSTMFWVGEFSIL